jgi:hypothetical protein
MFESSKNKTNILESAKMTHMKVGDSIEAFLIDQGLFPVIVWAYRWFFARVPSHQGTTPHHGQQ